MRIEEFDKKDDLELPFNVVEDAIVFMRNDPMFYRKQYYPTVAKMADLTRAGKPVDPKGFVMPMVTKGIEGYCEKYKLPRPSDSLFGEEDRINLMNRIYEEEMEQIHKGEYGEND